MKYRTCAYTFEVKIFIYHVYYLGEFLYSHYGSSSHKVDPLVDTAKCTLPNLITKIHCRSDDFRE